jgi:hypothetical protein
MDIWQKVFLYLGAANAAVILLVVLIVLSNAEDGMLTVEGVSHLQPQMASFYAIFKWFVYVWLISAAVVFVRFLMRLFGRR